LEGRVTLFHIWDYVKESAYQGVGYIYYSVILRDCFMSGEDVKVAGVYLVTFEATSA